MWGFALNVVIIFMYVIKNINNFNNMKIIKQLLNIANDYVENN